MLLIVSCLVMYLYNTNLDASTVKLLGSSLIHLLSTLQLLLTIRWKLHYSVAVDIVWTVKNEPMLTVFYKFIHANIASHYWATCFWDFHHGRFQYFHCYTVLYCVLDLIIFPLSQCAIFAYLVVSLLLLATPKVE